MSEIDRWAFTYLDEPNEGVWMSDEGGTRGKRKTEEMRQGMENIGWVCGPVVSVKLPLPEEIAL